VAAGRWWQETAVRASLEEALGYVNDARGLPRRRGWEVAACDDYFHALNQLANGYDHTQPPPPPRFDRPSEPARRPEPVKFQNLLRLLDRAEIVETLGSDAVATLARLTPLVMDHGTPGMRQLLADAPDAVKQDAASAHRRFRTAWERWSERGTDPLGTLDKLVRAVLVVRNNIDHGEKTPSGPDPQRRDRNQAVGQVVLPVLELALDVVLDRPSGKFAVYGTLRPGEPNHDVVTAKGTWTDVCVTGWLRDERGLPAFEFDVTGDQVPAALLTSQELPNTWERLDAFEGNRYERHLGIYQHAGTVGVANIYVWIGAAR
jgi:gamma-glutamylcyclotransferase (GGCT)/AIG2-like uncharacterized protein YtfP